MTWRERAICHSGYILVVIATKQLRKWRCHAYGRWFLFFSSIPEGLKIIFTIIITVYKKGTKCRAACSWVASSFSGLFNARPRVKSLRTFICIWMKTLSCFHIVIVTQVEAASSSLKILEVLPISLAELAKKFLYKINSHWENCLYFIELW